MSQRRRKPSLPGLTSEPSGKSSAASLGLAPDQSVLRENPTNRRSAHLMSDVLQGSLDPTVPPAAIIQSHPNDQLYYVALIRRLPRRDFKTRFSVCRYSIIFCCSRFTQPAKTRRRNCRTSVIECAILRQVSIVYHDSTRRRKFQSTGSCRRRVRERSDPGAALIYAH